MPKQRIKDAKLLQRYKKLYKANAALELKYSKLVEAALASHAVILQLKGQIATLETRCGCGKWCGGNQRMLRME